MAKKKKNSLREWFAQNDGKGWVDCKTGKPCGRQKEKSAVVILPVALLWHNARLLQRKRSHQKELVGRIKKLVVD